MTDLVPVKRTVKTWYPTHIVRYRTIDDSQEWEDLVMLHDHGLYLRVEWDNGLSCDWWLEKDGSLIFQGDPYAFAETSLVRASPAAIARIKAHTHYINFFDSLQEANSMAEEILNKPYNELPGPAQRYVSRGALDDVSMAGFWAWLLEEAIARG